MRIGVLGTGMVGQALGSRLVETGHDVVMGSRDAANEKAAAWAGAHSRSGQRPAPSPTPRRTARWCSTRPAGAVSLDALRLAGAENLAGKVLIDVVQPDEAGQRLPAAARPGGRRQPGRADPARVPGGPGRQDAEHDELRRDGRPVAACPVSTTSSWPGRTPRPRRSCAACCAASAGRTPRSATWAASPRRAGLEMYLIFWIGLRVSLGHNAFNIRVVT